jgi:sn-glycerol 3-phosphate transport system permease protein
MGYASLGVPRITTATATFLFRQLFLTVPEAPVEAARMAGAGPIRLFKVVLAPRSTTLIATLCMIHFIYGWNQNLWPLLVTTNENRYPEVISMQRMTSGGDAQTEWNTVMATALLAMVPAALVAMLMQRWFVKGLVDTER